MNKREAIKLLNSEGWTKADAQRAIKLLDFETNPDEMIIRRAASKFAGIELLKRQRLQAAQKTLVTKKTNEIQKYINQIEKLKQSNTLSSPDLAKKLTEISNKNTELVKANKSLQKDNKDLKNIVDAIRLKLTIQTKHLLQLKDSEIKKGLVKLLDSTLG